MNEDAFVVEDQAARPRSPVLLDLRLGSLRPCRVVVELEGGGGSLEPFGMAGVTAFEAELIRRRDLPEEVSVADG